MIILDVFLIVFLFACFAIPHSLLATIKFKRAIAAQIANKIAFYRLFYNISSFIFFMAFYSISPKPYVIIYDLQYPFDIITFALQILSLVGFIWAGRQMDLKEFLGISQVIRYLRGEYSIHDLDEKPTFKIAGAYKMVRHPIYLFSILFLGLRPQMDLFYFAMFISIVIYFYAGSIYEERKLVELFGDEYINYQKKVPRIFPIKFL
jgi:methanethiol S-methyltransferase